MWKLFSSLAYGRPQTTTRRGRCRQPVLEALERRETPACTLRLVGITGALDIQCDGAADSVQVDDWGTAIRVWHNGRYDEFSASGTGPGISIFPGAGADTVIVNRNTRPVYISGGGGLDVVNVGYFGSLQSVTRPIEIDNPPGGGYTEVNLYNMSDNFGRSVTMTSTQLSGLTPASAPIRYPRPGDLRALNVFAGSVIDTFIIENTPNSGYTGGMRTTIDTGGGADSVAVRNTTGPLRLTSSAGQDGVAIGHNGLLNGIQGNVEVLNPPSTTALTINDSGNTQRKSVTLNASNVLGLAGPYPTTSTISWNSADISTLTILGGNGGNTYNVQGVPNNNTFLRPGNGSGGSFNKNSSGLLTLTGVNSYTGPTNINAGTLRLGNAHVLPDAGAVAVGSGATLDLAGYPDTIGSLSGSGTVQLGSGTLTVDAVFTPEFSGGIHGTGGLTKTGTGTLVLSGSSTYSGRTAVLGGTLAVRNASALGSTGGATEVFSGGTLELRGAIQVFEPLFLYGGRLLGGGNTYSGQITLGGQAQIGSTGGLTLSVPAQVRGISGYNLTIPGGSFVNLSGNSDFAGTTTVSNGAVLMVSHGNALGTTAGNTTVQQGGRVELRGGITVGEPLTLNGVGPVGSAALYSGAGYNFWSGSVNLATTSAVGSAAGAQLVITGTVTGPTGAGLTIPGGTVLMGGPNNYQGPTEVRAGVLYVFSATALGTSGAGTTVAAGAILDMAGGITIAEPLTLSGTLRLDSTYPNVWSGSITLAAAATIANVSTGSLELSGPVDNSGHLLTLNPSNAGGRLTVSNVVRGAGGLTKVGAGPVTLNGNNVYTGPTQVNAGTLVAAHASALGAIGAPSGTTVNPGGTLELRENIWDEWLTLNSNGQTSTPALASPTGSRWGWVGPVHLATTSAVSNVTITGAIGGPSSASLILTGSVAMGGPNTYAGPTELRAGSSLYAFHSTVLGSPSAGTTVAAGATLDVAGGVTIAEPLTLGGTLRADSAYENIWSGAITLTAPTTIANIYTGNLEVRGPVDNGGHLLTLSVPSGSLTVSNVIRGAGGLTKTGAGPVTLNGANIYAGPTQSSAGTLLVNGNQPGSAVTVGSGATLGGSGRTGNVTANVGGRIVPGTSPGILNTGNVALTAGSILAVELNGPTPGTGYDRVNVTGTVNLGGATLNTTLGYTPANGTPFTIIANDGTDLVTGTFSGLAEGAFFTVGGRRFQITYRGGDGNEVVLTDSPVVTSLTFAGVPAVQSAGTAFTFTVTARDAGGLVVPTYRGTVRFSSSDPDAVLPADYTFTASDNGVKTFTATLHAPEDRTLTARDTVETQLTRTASVQVDPLGLTVLGTLGDDTVVLRNRETDARFYEVLLNAQLQTYGLWAALTGVALNGRAGNDVISVLAVSSGLPVTVEGEDGDDVVAVGSAMTSLDLILGPVEVRGQGNRDTLIVNDEAGPGGQTYTATSSAITRDAGPAVIFYETMEGVIFRASAAGANAIVVADSAADVPMTLNGSGSDSLWRVTGASIWSITGTDRGTLNGDGLGAPVDFSGCANLVGGDGDDTFAFADGQGITGLIDGGAGSNLLDYSAYTAGVFVELQNFVGHGTASVFNITYVHGGSGDDYIHGDAQGNWLVGNDGHDILVGDEGGDWLQGGDGRDLLFGGGGYDQLDGGLGDDLLIGGYTVYDQESYFLDAVAEFWNVWTQTEVDYYERIATLRGGTPSGYVLDATTVFSDGEFDEVYGQDGLDWFWLDEFDWTDREDPEVLN